MNKNINDRIEYLRDVLIAMINEHTGNGIPEEELKKHSDEVLCAEAALAFRVMQIAMRKFKEHSDKLEKNQFTRDELGLIKTAVSVIDEGNYSERICSIKAKCNAILQGDTK